MIRGFRNLKYSVLLKERLDKIITEMETSSSLFCVHPKTDFTRNRKLSFNTLVHFLLGIRGNSLNKELYDYFKDSESILTTSAFVQQRKKLLPEAMEYLLKEFNNICDDSKTLYGYHIYAVDGSDINIAKNPNSESYVSNGQNEGYNQLHLNALYDILNRTYKDCIIQPRPQMNESRACIDMIKRFSFQEKNLLLADRGYGAMNLFEHIHRADSIDYLIRVKNDFIKEIKALPMGELDTTVSFELRTTQTKADKTAYANGTAKWIAGNSKYGKYKKDVTWDFESPCSMTLRVVRFKITEDTYETIVTSLNRFEFPIERIKELYHLRWGIETSFRELKYAIGLVNFHAKKEDFIRQEIFARLVMYNFCERITLHVVIEQSDKRTHTYQVNYTMGIHICVDYFRHHGKEPPPDIEKSIARYILPVRKGRSDKRKLKPKSAVFFLYRVA